ncbi:MAG: histidine--tRNA ligase [Candidatus Omnitrophota bacterium]|jgi:histidyl-tRNA synthetase|nr:histidine--tRNA ligase [Candidatus Omnitrophota bacterium]
MPKALRGTKDILPSEISLWQYMESSARYIFSIYGYKEIRTPIIEEANLFIRSIGDNTDIVKKEMYVFTDRGKRTIALRPEATASIVRAYLENSLGQKESLTKLFYIGPMFRSERPQKGRQRQFHQLGVEAIGSDSPFLDVEAIVLAVKLLEKLGVKGFEVRINSLGCQKDKLGIIKHNRKNIKPLLSSLCSECKDRFDKNVLRIFDCKNEKCRDVVKGIKSGNCLCKGCEGHFDSVKKSLTRLGIKYVVDQKIVRGLDYYTKTVFEVTQKDLGAKDAICAGGRYNNLIHEMGGNKIPAVGFAFGTERLILALDKDVLPSGPSLDVFVAASSEDLREEAFSFLNALRSKGLSSDTDYEKKSLKAQMRKAEKLQARFVVIFGEEEFRENKVVLRDMEKRAQKTIALDSVASEIERKHS